MTTAAQPASRSADVAPWREEFERFRGAASAPEPAWLRLNRSRAFQAFEEQGFPSTRLEDWRHTSVAPIVRTRFVAPPPGPGLTDLTVLSGLGFGRAFEGRQAVFVNGRYEPALSSLDGADGVQVRSLRDVLARQPQLVEGALDALAQGPGRPFAALNAAFLDDGAVVLIPERCVLREAIHLVFYSAPGARPTASHPRVLVRAGRGSQASIIETYGGTADAGYLTNAVTEIVLEEGAVLDHYRLQRESAQGFHVGTLCVRQERASRFTSHAVSLGAALSRVDIRQEFAGEGGECVLNGLFLGSDHQHTDTHTWVDHARPHCTTRELYKGVVDGHAHGVFVGRILVRKDAQKTDAQQSNKNLILSRDALVDSVPQLEILADDVKCKHGSTTGQIDPQALFYLRSRGIGEEAARALLVYAFASEVVQRMGVEAVRAGLTEHLQRRLPGAGDLKEAV
jgi:Fe-S cluster assembly protein SufD